MLFKDCMGDLLSEDDGAMFAEHYERLVTIRLKFRPIKVPGSEENTWWMPYCHHVAHAYAEAFGVDVVDGEKVFITQTRTFWFGHFIRGKVSRYAHSWNLLSLPSGKRVILDLIPDETCSMLPIVVQDPHPAYVKHWDGLAERTVEEFLNRPYGKDRLHILAAEFKRICSES